MVGTGLLFMLIFHIGLKEPPRSCTYLFASKGSKRSAGNWIHWFKEIQFYQVCFKKKNQTLNFVPKNSENCISKRYKLWVTYVLFQKLLIVDFPFLKFSSQVRNF